MTEPPGQTGYRLPAEHEPHEATWMAWPHDERTWIAGLEAAEEAFLTMISALSQGERVDLIVRPEDAGHARDRLSTRDTGEVHLHEKDHADAWLRDTGPTILVNGSERVAVDWRFDAWGGKYEALKRDDDLAAFVADSLGIETYRVDHEMEGGAIEPNGAGSLLTTTSCLLEGRGHEREQIEQLFADVLGVEQTVWLDAALRGDDTDGHVDTLARFVAESRVALAVPGEASKADREELQRARRQLEETRLADGSSLDVVELPQPSPVEVEGEPRPASYANFAIGNDVVLLPCFSDPMDDVARERLSEVFPDRRVVDVPALPLVAGYGACHCLTQHVPTPAP